MTKKVLDYMNENGSISVPETRVLMGINKAAADALLAKLQMQTRVITGFIEREYRGANLTYSGWQRTSLTSPDQLFGPEHPEASAPAWARLFEAETGSGGNSTDCSPEESRQRIISHILEMVPEASTDILNKII